MAKTELKASERRALEELMRRVEKSPDSSDNHRPPHVVFALTKADAKCTHCEGPLDALTYQHVYFIQSAGPSSRPRFHFARNDPNNKGGAN